MLFRSVDRSGGATLRAGAVVRDEHDEGVVELTDLLEEVEEAADVMVRVLEEAGIDLHHPRVQLAFIGSQTVPALYVRIVAGQQIGRAHV